MARIISAPIIAHVSDLLGPSFHPRRVLFKSLSASPPPFPVGVNDPPVVFPPISFFRLFRRLFSPEPVLGAGLACWSCVLVLLARSILVRLHRFSPKQRLFFNPNHGQFFFYQFVSLSAHQSLADCEYPRVRARVRLHVHGRVRACSLASVRLCDLACVCACVRVCVCVSHLFRHS